MFEAIADKIFILCRRYVCAKLAKPLAARHSVAGSFLHSLPLLQSTAAKILGEYAGSRTRALCAYKLGTLFATQGELKV